MRLIFIFLILLSIIFTSCKTDEPLKSQDQNQIKPPVQKGEIDLVGFSDQLIEAVAVNQKEPWNILVSTGSPDRRVFVSNDYGITWSVKFDSIRSMCLSWDNQKPSIAYITRNRKMPEDWYELRPVIFKTSDYGKSWFAADSGISYYYIGSHFTTVTTDYFNSDYVYAVGTATSNIMPGEGGWLFYISTNGGKTFSNSVEVFFYFNLDIYLVKDVATSNLKSGVVYVTICRDSRDYELAVSSDFGNTWFLKDVINGWYSDAIKVFNETVVLTVTDSYYPFKFGYYEISSRILISKDGGISFTMIDNSKVDYSQVKDFLITPEGYIIFTGVLQSDPTKTMIYISKDGGNTWQTLSSDSESKTFLSYDPKNKFLYFVKDKKNKGLYRIKLD